MFILKLLLNINYLILSLTTSAGTLLKNPCVIVPEVHCAAQECSVIDKEDINILARMIYAEARGECLEGQYAVACVAVNRLEHGGFGNTLYDVITRPHQFAVSNKTNADCISVAEDVLSGNRPLPKDILYFQKSKTKTWRNFIY